MIRYITGNIFDDDAQALVNTVNTEGVMGKGLALQFKERFPENFRVYRLACKEHRLDVGNMLIVDESTIERQLLVINFPTKRSWRKPSEYDYIESGLNSLRTEIISRGIKSVAIPALGSCNGGLDWCRVKQMIVSQLSDIDCDIRIYEPNAMIVEQMKSERVKLTPARAMMLDMMWDLVSFGEFVSVFAAEKIIYFLQRFGARKVFNIDYSRSFYGPYSSGKIAHVLYYLNGSFIKGMTAMQNKPFQEIWLVKDSQNELSDFLKTPEMSDKLSVLDKTKDFLSGYYDNSSLELLSTVDYLLQNDPRLSNWLNMSDYEVESILSLDIAEWSKRKERMFVGTPYVKMALQHLREWKDELYMAA